jgi:hypothetical protein
MYILTDNMLQAGRSRGCIPDEVIGFFNLPKPSRRTMFLGSTKGRPARKIDNLTENVGASTSHNHMGFHGLLQG